MGIYRLPNGLVIGAALRTAHATARPMRCSVRCPQRSGSTGMTRPKMTKAMRGRIALQKHFVQNSGNTVALFCAALRVRTRPRVALVLRSWAPQRQGTHAE